MKLTASEYQIIRLLGALKNGKPPITAHGALRLKQRRRDVPFEEAITDVVHAWSDGIDMSTDPFYTDMLSGIVRHWDFKKYRYVFYKNFVYVFDKHRTMITILRASGKL